VSRYEWREGFGIWDRARGTYLLLHDDEHARILWAALNARLTSPAREALRRALAGDPPALHEPTSEDEAAAMAVPSNEDIARVILGAVGGNPRIGEVPATYMRAAEQVRAMIAAARKGAG
jgi:hypothetical protein